MFWIRSSAMLQICQTWTKMNKVLWDFDDKHLLNTREKKGCSCSTESTQAHAKEFSSSFLAFAIAASVSELANSHKQRAKFDSLSVLHFLWEQSSRRENTTDPQHSDTKSQLHDKRFTSCRFGVQCKKCNGSLFVAIVFLESSSSKASTQYVQKSAVSTLRLLLDCFFSHLLRKPNALKTTHASSC